MKVILVTYIFLFTISFLFSKENMKYYFFIISLTFSIIALFFVPDESMDLYRHYEYLDVLRDYGWKLAITVSPFGSSIVANLYFYLISFLGVNGLLPAITAFITYYLTLNRIYEVALKYNCSKANILLSTFYFISMLGYLSLISGIRSLLAFALFSYFLYIDLVENKKKILCWSIYIALSLFHSSVWVLLIFRVMLRFYNKFTRIAYIAFLTTWSLNIANIINFIDNFSNIKILQELQQKVSLYTVGGYFTDYSIRDSLIILIVICITFLFFLYTNRNQNKEMKSYFDYIILIIAFCIGSINYYRVFVSFVAVLYFLSPTYILLINHNPVFGFIRKQRCKHNKQYNSHNISLNYIFTLIIIEVSIYKLLILFKKEYLYMIFKL
ncbi:EpsG family protein [Clostridium peptidivorans]|uniref:EpsG family protein n=1 Tax=Clostridium peptidivorans TaxID=100174 RepID=UPI000BE38D23|nr:EpsG family protein [Clostridium peptidivorans]